MPSSSPNLRGRVDLRQAVWEREMRRVALSIRLFLSLVVALGARIAFAGLDLTSGVAVIVAIALLFASLYLARLVHQQRPVPRRAADPSVPRARRGDGERH